MHETQLGGKSVDARGVLQTGHKMCAGAGAWAILGGYICKHYANAMAVSSIEIVSIILLFGKDMYKVLLLILPSL